MLNRFENFTFLISEISHSWNRIAAAVMKEHGFKAAYAFYIVMLHKHPDGLTSAELCKMCDKDKAEISRAIDILEKNEIILRDKVLGNNYRALIKLTDKGCDVAKKIEDRATQAVEFTGNYMTESERETFYTTLTQIASNLRIFSEREL